MQNEKKDKYNNNSLRNSNFQITVFKSIAHHIRTDCTNIRQHRKRQSVEDNNSSSNKLVCESSTTASDWMWKQYENSLRITSKNQSYQHTVLFPEPCFLGSADHRIRANLAITGQIPNKDNDYTNKHFYL